MEFPKLGLQVNICIQCGKDMFDKSKLYHLHNAFYSYSLFLKSTEFFSSKYYGYGCCIRLRRNLSTIISNWCLVIFKGWIHILILVFIRKNRGANTVFYFFCSKLELMLMTKCSHHKWKQRMCQFGYKFEGNERGKVYGGGWGI